MINIMHLTGAFPPCLSSPLQFNFWHSLLYETRHRLSLPSQALLVDERFS